MRALRRFGAFWFDFVVGDDWMTAAGIGLALALTGVLAHEDVNAWWLMPAAVALVLVGSLRRAVRRASRSRG